MMVRTTKLMIAQVELGTLQKSASTYQLEVVLNDVQPRIWRRLQVPGHANLGWLHAVLQVAMGWTNSHLHQFICREHVYADPSAELEEYEGDPPILDEGKATLWELLPEINNSLVYDYDFGDSWDHLIVVEKILKNPLSSTLVARCLGGERACPPEDCGGAGGYEALLKILKNRKHPEHKAMKEWLGRPFDSELFDEAKTNTLLSKLKWPHVTEGQLRKVLMARDGFEQ
jgi:Plasmid pRiA4b ORF-3-like protein